MKADKFKNLAQKRVNRALKQLSLIGNLSNRGSYDYTPEQVDQIFSALQTELVSTKARFVCRQPNGTDDGQFIL